MQNVKWYSLHKSEIKWCPIGDFNFQSGTCSVSEMFPRLPQGSNPGPPLPEASALTTRLLLLTQDRSECTPGNKCAMFKCVQALNPLIFPATPRGLCVCGGGRGYSHIGTVRVCHGKASHFWAWLLLKTPLFRPVQLKTIILFIKIYVFCGYF